jgi:hypothetical protein
MSEAAFREFREELGVNANVLQRCGELSPLYVYASNNFVHPVVAVIDRPDPWKPDPVEVDQVIALPVAHLTESRFAGLTGAVSQNQWVKRGVMTDAGEVDQLRFSAPAFDYQGHLIWGATALILDQLAQILLEEG